MERQKLITYGFIIISTVILTLLIIYAQTSHIIYGIIIISLLYYYFFYSEENIMDVLTELTPLSIPKQIVTAEKTQRTLLEKGGSTVMGFFNLQQGDRTTKYIDKLRPDEYTPIMHVAGNWSFEISQSPGGVLDTNARLRVTTKDSSGTATDQIMDLPSLPKQKWVCIAILRDGRRFDIMYDNKIVASQRLQNYPVVISNPLRIGNKKLAGSVIHIIISDRRLTPTEVDRERLKYVDTNNMIIESNAINISFPNIRLFSQCPPGLPCDPVTKPPRDNLLQWKTPYA
jgi:hypothetical protein